MLFQVSELYQEMWKAIIRPPRDYYGVSELGPSCFIFNNQYFKRRENSRGLKLQCSHFEPVERDGEYLKTPYPCVIYLHGNCSSRLEALNCGCLRALLPQGISVLCFDFSGCGLSEGEYVSLGWHERDDLEKVIAHLRSLDRISTIGLWGRSMGAVTACMFADSDPTIAGIVVDSPFASLRRLAEELASDFVGWRVPKILLNPALNMVRNTIQSRAKFDLDDLQPIEHCKQTYTPALFIAAKDDSFIRPHHCREMHDVSLDVEMRNQCLVEGGHNSPRPSFLQDSVAIFFRFALQISEASRLDGTETAVWDEVAMSLAGAERLRRERLMLEAGVTAAQSDDGRQTVPRSSSRRHQQRHRSDPARHYSRELPVRTDDARSLAEDDDLCLTTSIAQMVILESIRESQSAAHASTHSSACGDDNLDISHLHDVELEHLISNVVEEECERKAATVEGCPPPTTTSLFTMPAAPHRVCKGSVAKDEPISEQVLNASVTATATTSGASNDTATRSWFSSRFRMRPSDASSTFKF